MWVVLTGLSVRFCGEISGTREKNARKHLSDKGTKILIWKMHHIKVSPKILIAQ